VLRLLNPPERSSLGALQSIDRNLYLPPFSLEEASWIASQSRRYVAGLPHASVPMVYSFNSTGESANDFWPT
jgi:hypothetical protein